MGTLLQGLQQLAQAVQGFGDALLQHAHIHDRLQILGSGVFSATDELRLAFMVLEDCREHRPRQPFRNIAFRI